MESKEQNKNIKVVIWLLIACAIGLFFAFAEESKAFTYEQTVSNYSPGAVIQADSPSTNVLSAFTGITGEFEYLEVKWNRGGLGILDIGYQLYECNASTTANPIIGDNTIGENVTACGGTLIINDDEFFPMTSGTAVTASTTPPAGNILNPSRWYLFVLTEESSSGNGYISSGAVSDVNMTQAYSCTNSGCFTQNSTIYYKIETDFIPPPVDNQSVIYNIQPEYYSTVASTTFEVSATYWNQGENTEVDKVCVYLNNIEEITWNLPLNDKTICFDIVASGENNFSTTTQIGEGAVQGEWYAWDSINDTKYFNEGTQFNVIQSGIPITQINPVSELEGCNAPEGILEEFSCWILTAWIDSMKWLFAPSPAQIERFKLTWISAEQKAPIGYYYLAKNQFDTVLNASSTVGSNIVVTIPQITGGTGEITMINWESMKVSYTENYSSIGQFLIYFTWIAFAIYAFYRITGMLNKE